MRGGAFRDPAGAGLPRVTLLATAGGPGGGRAGWAAICRLVSAVHLAGERGTPVATLDLLAPWLAGGDVTVLLGPASEVGVAVGRRRDDDAAAALAAWREVLPSGRLHVELVSHRLGRPGPGGTGEWGPASAAHAARMAGLAHRAGVGTVLTNAVRYADRRDAPTVDVLDASRRLVALDRRHLDRVNAEGFLKSGKQMLEVAEEIGRLAGLEARSAAPAARPHPRRRRQLRPRPARRPRPRRGALPRIRCSQPGRQCGRGRRRCRAARPLRGGGRRPLRLGPAAAHLEASRRRARADPRPRLRVVLPHRRRRHRPDPRARGALRGAGVRRGQPGQLPARRLRHRPDPPPPADGAVPLAAARVAARHRRRRGVRAAHRDLRGDPRPLRRRALRLRLDDGHLPRPPRGARRRRRARHAAR